MRHCRRIILAAAAALFVTSPQIVAAKQHRVAIVLPDEEWASSVVGLKEGMTALGYAEGKDIVYLMDDARGDQTRMLESTKKFVAEKPDAIYTVTNTALKVVIDATHASKTPVIFGSASGPVESGLVRGYVTPDSHVTGVTSGSIELVQKRLEILKQVLPRVKTIAAIGDLEADSSKAAFRLAEETARQLGLKLKPIRVTSREHAIESAKKITAKDADAIFLIPGFYSVSAVTGIAAQSKNARLPFGVYQLEHIKIPGALLSYGSSYYLDGKQSAGLLDKVLKGVPPGQLPIERPRQVQLILNLDTAKDIGISFRPEILSRADELIEAAKSP
jgi:ABC-type uncharacterized transport system substrate-binding protein